MTFFWSLGMMLAFGNDVKALATLRCDRLHLYKVIERHTVMGVLKAETQQVTLAGLVTPPF